MVNNGLATLGSYYYSCLTTGQRHLYDSLLLGIRKMSTKVLLPIRPINEIARIFDCIQYDHPDIFHVAGFSQSNDAYKKKCTIKPEYKYTPSFVNEKKKIVGEYLRRFDAVKMLSDYEKELHIHDHCLENFSYDHAKDEYANSLLGCVLNGRAVCEGIAKFVKLVSDYVGLENVYVTGKAADPARDGRAENHAWNIVKIDGEYFHLDATFDMTIMDKDKRYDYFNLSDGDIKKDHAISVDAPVCRVEGKDYYSRNGLVLKTPKALELFIGNNLINGISKMVFKLPGTKNSDKVVEKVRAIALRRYMDIYKRDVAIRYSLNQSQMVFEIEYSR